MGKMETAIYYLAFTAVAGGALGAHQANVVPWLGGICAAVGLIGVGAIYILLLGFDQGLATNPVVWGIAFLFTVEQAAPYCKLDLRQAAATAAGGLVLTVMVGLFLIAID